MKSIARFILRSMLPVTGLGLMSGCPSKASQQDDVFAVFDASMVRSDLEAMEDATEGVHALTKEGFNAFVAIFGGTSAQDVRNYVEERAKIFVPYSLVDHHLHPIGRPRHRNVRAFDNPPDDPEMPEVGILAAANVGTQLYWMSRLTDQPIFVVNDDGLGQPVTPRSGLIAVPDDYLGSMRRILGNLGGDGDPASERQAESLMRLIRQGTLVHEARHSDCADEPSEADVAAGRAAAHARAFRETTSAASCGFLHAFCRGEGHTFRGLAACDDRPWGSYGVGLVHMMAVRGSFAPHTVEALMMDALVVDSRGRLEGFDIEAMLAGGLEPPDTRGFDAPAPRDHL